MTGWSYVLALAIGLVAVPLTVALVDLVPAWRAGRSRVFPIRSSTVPVHDFAVLVPIYGDVKYLENVDYLSAYGSRVCLITTDAEPREFYAALEAIAQEHGFWIFRGHVPGRGGEDGGRRQVAGTIRDRLIRDASRDIKSRYVVCIDADTRTDLPLSHLIGAIEENDLDFASVELVPSNRGSLLARLQRHEYRMAMRLRRLLPWLVSGACHAGRTEVHREVMSRHSLFFQGNDAELGLLAHALGYRVGHVPFEVPTTVPETLRPLWRQRFAWAGGEFRLYVMNLHLLPRHPMFFLYGALVVVALAPLRLMSFSRLSVGVLAVLVIYAVFVTALNWRHRDKALVLLPFYLMFTSLVMVPLGVVSYLRMAIKDRNAGLIRLRRGQLRVAPGRHRRPTSLPGTLAPVSRSALALDPQLSR